MDHKNSSKSKNAIQTAPGFDIGFITVPALLVIPLIAGMILGGYTPWQQNNYNSYVLQAQAWLGGHLDLGGDYPWLEIAHFGGKHYISFPPFPSYVYLPFILVFGRFFCDGWIAVFSYLLGGCAVYGIFSHFGTRKSAAVILTVCFCAGTNLLFVSVNAWVWFIAQNMCFTLTAGALYCALKDRRAAALALISCAVGCRPFQILYFPLIIYILYKNEKEKSGAFKLSAQLLLPFIAPLIIGGSYMALNFLRFGNVFEFGHNYLPEFVNAEHGQFSPVYLRQNLFSLIRLPEFDGGHIVFSKFDGFNMFIASPPLLLFLYFAARGVKHRNSRALTLIVLLSFCAELLCITMHKTMGGWHYGNRYTIDTIPFALMICAAQAAELKKPHTATVFAAALTLCGMALNLYWIYIFN